MKTWLTVLFSIILSLVVLVLYLSVSFVFGGHELLKGVMGNDAWSYITRLKMLADHFPNYPFWNYKEAAGASLTYVYPILTHTLLIVTSKLFSISLFESFKLWGYLSVPLFAWGIFIFGLVRLRLPVVGLLGGLFYILSPISSIWIFEWGFYAESVASFLFPFAFLFFDLFLTNSLDEGWKSLKTRIYFLITALLMGITFLAHPTVFFGVLTFMLLYAVGLGLVEKENKLRKLIETGLKAVGVTVASVLLVAFWSLPFYNYTSVVGQGDTAGKLTKQNYGIDLELAKVLSFKPPMETSAEEYFKTHTELEEGDSMVNGRVWEKGYIFKNFSFPKGISILYIVGIVLAVILFKPRRMVLFALSLITLFAAVSDDFIILLANTPFLGYFASWRSLIYADRMLIPLGAAFACYGVLGVLFIPFRKIKAVEIVRPLILSIAALVIAYTVILNFRQSADNPSPEYLSAYARNLHLRNIWKESRLIPDDLCLLASFKDSNHCKDKTLTSYFYPTGIIGNCRVAVDRPSVCNENFTESDILSLVNTCKTGSNPQYNQTFCTAMVGLDDAVDAGLSEVKVREQLSQFWGGEFSANPEMLEMYSHIPVNPFLRFDFSPLQTAASMRAPYFVVTPGFNSYVHTAYLNRRLVGLEISSLYADDPIYPDPLAIPEIAKWFGNSIFIVNPAEDADKFDQSGLEKVNDYFYRQNDENYIVEMSNKPKILVIGSEDKQAYDTIFKFAPFGFIDYDQAMLIRGNEKVDSYSKEELSEYEGIILYGYKYGLKGRGWDLLDNYVRNGGRVFIETGWQWESADYQIDGAAPEFLPVNDLTWGNVGKASSYQVNSEIVGEIDTTGFPPLVWNDLPWGLSVPSGLKPWAKPVLSAEGKTLIAVGQYGQGRIVWSGMNIFGHIKGFDRNNQEMGVLRRAMEWLMQGTHHPGLAFGSDYEARRINNDRIEITSRWPIEGYGLYLKEAYHPWWRAEVVRSGGGKTKLDILYAGPGYKFVDLPNLSGGDKVVFYVDRSFIYFARIVSLLTLIVLGVLFVKTEFVKVKLPNISLSKSKASVNEDIDY